MKEKTISDIIEKHINGSDSQKVGYNRRQITLSMSPEAKTDFDMLQNQTDNKFGKAMKEIFEKAIEIAKSKLDSAS